MTRARIRGYSFLEHEGEMGVQAWGESLEDLFQAAADGLYHILRRNFTLIDDAERVLRLTENAPDLLLRAFLAELLFYQSAHAEIYPHREFLELTETGLRVRLVGGHYDPVREPLDREIKAVTYYRLRVWQDRNRWWATYIVDV